MTGINIETSLLCGAQCAVCCVEAPAWSGNWDRLAGHERLKNVIARWV